jgi:pimeloyl-ACP methyl ester carboxylesterase
VCPGTMMRSKKPFIALVVVVVFLFFGTFSIQGVEHTPSSLAQYQSQKITWSTCYDGFECTYLQVPVDYLNLKEGRFNLRVLRHKATSQRKKIGSLVINPGGPGASGVDYALNAEYIFGPALLEKYDIVGFDPRGVGQSDPIRCLTNSQTDASIAADGKPDSQKELKLLIKETRQYVSRCESRTKDILHYSTADSARDMDLLRAALGEKKLNYLGVSYGTYLGTLYASFFPSRVGRMVLDGAISPIVSSTDQNLTQAIGFDLALDAFIADCYTRSDCVLKKPVAAARLQVISLFQNAARKPLSSTKGRVVSESLVVLGTASALYDRATGWPQLRAAIKQSQTGAGDNFLALADQYAQRNSDGTFGSNETDAQFVIDCLDWKGARTTAEIVSEAKIFAVRAPVFGPYLAYSGLACQFFPKLEIVAPVIKNISTTPIIIVGTTRDPATPYSWALDLHSTIRNSRLVSLNGDGHTGYGHGSSCVDNAVDHYFLTGLPPLQDLTCTSPI